MMRKTVPAAAAAMLLSILSTNPVSAQHAHGVQPSGVQGVHASPAVAAASQHVLVHRTVGCGCCLAWVDHLRTAGFEVEVRDHASLVAQKSALGVPVDKQSCHTAEVGGYFIEGHVPAGDIRRLLAEAPLARGLAVPGMPAGSPGMEMPDGSVHPYAVELIGADGASSEFARHGDSAID